jgi:hypothetical protein
MSAALIDQVYIWNVMFTRHRDAEARIPGASDERAGSAC